MEPTSINGSSVVAFDPTTQTTYIRLPQGLWRPCGGCKCDPCKRDGSPGYWDTLAIPSKGTAWTVHMPDPSSFRAYIAGLTSKRRAVLTVIK